MQNNLRFRLGDEIADLHLALFVRRFRRTRREFLEARIIAERIEHWIEPEQRRSERRKLSEKFPLLFRRERGDDPQESRMEGKTATEAASECGQ